MKDAPEENSPSPGMEERRQAAIEKWQKLCEEHPTLSKEALWELLTKRKHQLIYGPCP
jgi:hypothetical protein